MGFAVGGSFAFGLYGPQAAAQYMKAAEQRAAEHDAKSKKEETDEALAYYTLWLMVFTGILAIATIGLGGATLGLYFTGEKQIAHNAKIAAAQSRDMRDSIATANDANDLNRQNFESVHRPKIRIKHVRLTDTLWHGNQLTFKLVFVNSGVSGANLIDCGVRTYVIRGQESLPAIPDIPDRTPSGFRRLALPSGISMEIDQLTDGHVLTEPEHVALRNQSRVLFCAGYIHYSDDAGMRTTAFLYRLIVGDGVDNYRLAPVEDHDYSYAD
jgi:hypothetical protein